MSETISLLTKIFKEQGISNIINDMKTEMEKIEKNALNEKEKFYRFIKENDITLKTKENIVYDLEKRYEELDNEDIIRFLTFLEWSIIIVIDELLTKRFYKKNHRKKTKEELKNSEPIYFNIIIKNDIDFKQVNYEENKIDIIKKSDIQKLINENFVKRDKKTSKESIFLKKYIKDLVKYGNSLYLLILKRLGNKNMSKIKNLYNFYNSEGAKRISEETMRLSVHRYKMDI